MVVPTPDLIIHLGCRMFVGRQLTESKTSKSRCGNLKQTKRRSTQIWLSWWLVSAGRIIQVTLSNLVAVNHTKHVEEHTSQQTPYLLILSWPHAHTVSERMALRSMPANLVVAVSSLSTSKLLVFLVTPPLRLPPKTLSHLEYSRMINKVFLLPHQGAVLGLRLTTKYRVVFKAQCQDIVSCCKFLTATLNLKSIDKQKCHLQKLQLGECNGNIHRWFLVRGVLLLLVSSPILFIIGRATLYSFNHLVKGGPTWKAPSSQSAYLSRHVVRLDL